jgi:hypothetical protein
MNRKGKEKNGKENLKTRQALALGCMARDGHGNC